MDTALEKYGMQHTLKDLFYLLKNKLYPYDHIESEKRERYINMLAMQFLF